MNRKQALQMLGAAFIAASQLTQDRRSVAPEGFDPMAAKTVIDTYGTEATVINNTSSAYAPLTPSQQGGRVRFLMFTRQYATEAAGDDTALCVIPKGARIINGCIQVSATTGAATLAVGLKGKDDSGFIDAAGVVSDATGLLLAAAAITTTVQVPFAVTQALKSLYPAEKDLWLTVTTAAAAMASQLITGWVLYVLD